LLDTNVFSEIRKGQRADANVAKWVATAAIVEMGTSVVVLAELRRGIESKRRKDPKQAQDLERWFLKTRLNLADRVYPVTEPIADVWARQSVPDLLPFVDGVLAATALVHGWILVTRNVKDVARTGVSILNPWNDSSL
jgi:toxin FitB